MNLNDAINQVTTLKNQYKAFERLEEFLVEVQRLDSALRGMEGNKLALASEIESLRSARDAESKTTEQFISDMEANRDRVRDKVNAEIAEFREEAKLERATLDDEILWLRQAKDSLVADNASLKSQMDAEISAKQDTLKGLEDLIRDTRARLKGIG